MPITYRIDKPGRTVFSKAEGVLATQEIIAHHQGLLQDPDFDPSFDQLWDGTELTSFDVSSSDVPAIAATKLFGEGSRRAMVVPDNPYIFGMIRMFQLLRNTEPDMVQIFHDMDEAHKWLGLD